MSLLSSSPMYTLSSKVGHMHATNPVIILYHVQHKFLLAPSIPNNRCYRMSISKVERELQSGHRFLGEPQSLILHFKSERSTPRRKSSPVFASWFASSQVASGVFTIATVVVLPFYALMVLAPKSNLTLRSIDSSIPYIFLGALYAFLLYLSWTPDTLRLMFASKYWLPELAGIAHMFKNELTLASAWIHLLVVDLFAARQVFHDGQKQDIETRHSVSLCLLFCPIGILSHTLTKAFSGRRSNGM